MPRFFCRSVALCLTVWALLPAQVLAAAFGWDDVSAIAQREAAAPYVEPAQTVPAELAALGYDALRDIRYRPDHAVWRREGLPFELQLFHMGGGNRVPVQISEVVDGTPRALGYDPAAWDFGSNAGRNRLDQRAWGSLGHAGFRVHYLLNPAPAGAAYKDELVVFLGASYFRALGRGQQYGLSARALAIDTVGGAQGEEFPRFKAFWIERPAANATTLTIHALLESRRATAAWRIVLRPGNAAVAETVMDVQQRIYLRPAALANAGAAGAVVTAGAAGVVGLASTAGPVSPAGPVDAIRTLGIAPLTSMFLHGENQPARQPAGDFRPEVHDSDGLLLAADGQWVWRPLFNPATPLVSSLAVQRLQGFGLMQRDRRFDAYEDSETRYDRRPSAWVEPLGDWGAGRVELVQLHTPDETHDNVVAYWVPAQLPATGQPLQLDYRLHWQGAAQQLPPDGWAVQARRGRSWMAAADAAPVPVPVPASVAPTASAASAASTASAASAAPAAFNAPAAGDVAGTSAVGGAGADLQFVIDFDGPALRALPPDAAVTAAASAGPNARIAEARAWPHPLGGWRMQLRVQRLAPDAAASAAAATSTNASTNAPMGAPKTAPTTVPTNAAANAPTNAAANTPTNGPRNAPASTAPPGPAPQAPLELRAQLQLQTPAGPRALTETWAALVPPEPTP